MEKIDMAIVGGGIVGLWTSYFALLKNPESIVVVFETEPFLGDHTSGRNSEVLHAGIYYPHDSLKHLHCIEGNRLWRNFLKQHNLHFLDCGKSIVANHLQEKDLEIIYQNARRNNVPGLCHLSKKQVDELTPHLKISSGLFSPTSAVLDVSLCIKALRYEIEKLGGIILTNHSLSILEHSAEHFVLQANQEIIHSQVLVNCAGLKAVDLRASLHLSDFENYYVKGSYLKLRKKLDLNHLIYPIPPTNGLGLGIHITMDVNGDQKFGPNTEIVSSIDYSLNENLISEMYPAISEIFNNVSKDDLIVGYAGVRPKVKRNGQIVTDFVFQTEKEHKIKGYFEFLGIESPGLTASPSLGKMLSRFL